MRRTVDVSKSIDIDDVDEAWCHLSPAQTLRFDNREGKWNEAHEKILQEAREHVPRLSFRTFSTITSGEAEPRAALTSKKSRLATRYRPYVATSDRMIFRKTAKRHASIFIVLENRVCPGGKE
jgi:hypothetical protein